MYSLIEQSHSEFVPKEWLRSGQLSRRRWRQVWLQVDSCLQYTARFAISERWWVERIRTGKWCAGSDICCAENIWTGRTCSARSYFSDCMSKYMCRLIVLLQWIFQRTDSKGSVYCMERCLCRNKFSGIQSWTEQYFESISSDFADDLSDGNRIDCIGIFASVDRKMEICLSGYDSDDRTDKRFLYIRNAWGKNGRDYNGFKESAVV